MRHELITPIKIAGFDFDDTLVTRHGYNYVSPNVLKKVRDLYDNGYLIVIFTNELLDRFKNPQSIKNAVDKKTSKLDRFINEVGIPIQIFIATRRDDYRKSVGIKMFTKMKELFIINDDEVDIMNSFFVGDSDGKRGSYSDADKVFAEMVGIRFLDESYIK